MQCPCQPQNRLHITRCTNDLRCIAGSQPPVSQSACGISPSQLWDLERPLPANLNAAAAAKLARPGQPPDSLAPAILHALQQFGDSMADQSRNRPGRNRVQPRTRIIFPIWWKRVASEERFQAGGK